MKNKQQLSAILFAATWLCGGHVAYSQAELPAPRHHSLRTDQQRMSYAIGLNFIKRLASDGIAVDEQALDQGIRDALSSSRPLLSEVEIRETLESLDRRIAELQKQRWEQLARQNKKEGPAFLANSRLQQGVVTLPSGLQYRVIKSGNGPKPRITDVVRTHYRGKLIDGTEFDSSFSRGQPAEFPVSGVIRGWTEALLMMRVSDKWQLFVPAALAYGPRGVEPVIGPHAVLIYEVELLGIK